ncbi:MAG: hypothetical protein ACYDEB_04755, partial [Dehalococcoidia bacterium]
PTQQQAYVRVVRPAISLHVTVAASEGSAALVVTVTNSSTAHLQNVVVFADFLDGAELVPSSTHAHYTSDASDQTLSIADGWLRDSVNLGNLPPHAAVELTFRARTPAPLVQQRTVIWVKSDELDWIYTTPSELLPPSGTPISVP